MEVLDDISEAITGSVKKAVLSLLAESFHISPTTLQGPAIINQP